jgi:hypothetical protein
MVLLSRRPEGYRTHPHVEINLQARAKVSSRRETCRERFGTLLGETGVLKNSEESCACEDSGIRFSEVEKNPAGKPFIGCQEHHQWFTRAIGSLTTILMLIIGSREAKVQQINRLFRA